MKTDEEIKVGDSLYSEFHSIEWRIVRETKQSWIGEHWNKERAIRKSDLTAPDGDGLRAQFFTSDGLKAEKERKAQMHKDSQERQAWMNKHKFYLARSLDNANVATLDKVVAFLIGEGAWKGPTV